MSAMRSAPSRLGLLALTLALAPASAHAYAVLAPGELLRMDALIVYEAGEEVLILSPVVKDGGALVLPLPEGARLLETRPEAPEWLGVRSGAPQAEDPAAREAAADREAPRVEPRQAPRASRADLGRREAPGLGGLLESGAPGSELPPPMARADEILLIPADRLEAALESCGAPRPGVDAQRLLRGAPMALVVKLPRDPVAMRLRPIAVALGSAWPRIPLAEAASAPHPLALRLLGAGASFDPGGMDFAFGLRRAGGVGEVPVSLLAWLEGKLERPDRGWRGAAFTAAAMDPSRAGGAKLADLRLPPPPGARRARPAPKPGPAAASSPGPAAPPEGCEGCSGSGGRGGLALLLVLLFLRRRTS
ncbi:MAG: hypothetical protein P1V51_15745 [Deltaproteobacteria bacterium]|nr:hypothetical protein [Deltaproteobacteria bacterium]